MRTLYWTLSVIVLVGGLYAFNSYIYNEKQADMHTDTRAMEDSIFSVIPIQHATGILVLGGTTIYFDPTGGAEAFAGLPPADIVLVTDIHGDHLDVDTLKAVVREAHLVVPKAVKDELPVELAAKAEVMENGETLDIDGVRIEATPMYNLPDAENANFHTKGRGNGYLVEKEGFRVYLAGDTAGTPEMRAMEDIDVAFVPMNLPYTMSVDEAADAVLAFKPKVVYPFHYRGPDGLADVERFKELVNAGDPSIEVILAKWY
jgi:L-ascorbate metabolism protein UlaG (beta-lactamase superfamily)